MKGAGRDENPEHAPRTRSNGGNSALRNKSLPKEIRNADRAQKNEGLSAGTCSLWKLHNRAKRKKVPNDGVALDRALRDDNFHLQVL